MPEFLNKQFQENLIKITKENKELKEENERLKAELELLKKKQLKNADKIEHSKSLWWELEERQLVKEALENRRKMNINYVRIDQSEEDWQKEVAQLKWTPMPEGTWEKLIEKDKENSQNKS